MLVQEFVSSSLLKQNTQYQNNIIMPRYFIEVMYKGTNYSGLQTQINAITIQSVIENAFQKILRTPINLTGSSRTDTGVHALQNFFHIDTNDKFPIQKIYNINAILPPDIVVKNIYAVPPQTHCRFNALSRQYKYFIATQKNPFIQDRSYYYPYTINLTLLQQAAAIIQTQNNFINFSKKHTQVNNFICDIQKSQWNTTQYGYIYNIQANRFLRGMIRALVATMLNVGRGSLAIQEFENLFQHNEKKLVDFSAPAQGLFLIAVSYPENLLTLL